jgi:hypothetical protein
VERWRPAKHYVLIDDKLPILDAVKRIWGERVTTVFDYALDAATLADLPAADITIDRIGDLMNYDLTALNRRLGRQGYGAESHFI